MMAHLLLPAYLQSCSGGGGDGGAGGLEAKRLHSFHLSSCGGKGMVRCVDSSKVSCARVKLTLIHSPRLHPRQLCLHSVLYGHLDQFCVSFPTFYTETYIHIITYHHHHQPWISSDPPSLHHIFFKALNLHIMKSLKMMVSMITVMRIYGLA